MAEIERKYWLMTFVKWITIVRMLLNVKYEDVPYYSDCGYCKIVPPEGGCFINPKICDCYQRRKGQSYHTKWIYAKTKKIQLKYALLILEWVVKEGYRLKYMNEENEKEYNALVNNDS